MDDWSVYGETFMPSNKTAKTSFTKSTNHGKRWTDDQEDEMAELFNKGIPIKDIAKQLSRGINGVRIKLINMGLLEDGDVF